MANARMPIVRRPSAAAIDHRNTLAKSTAAPSGATKSSVDASGSSGRSSVIDMADRLRLAVAQDAELVAFGIGEHDPGHVLPLTDVHVPGAHVDQPLDLGVAVVRIEVDV